MKLSIGIPIYDRKISYLDRVLKGLELSSGRYSSKEVSWKTHQGKNVNDAICTLFDEAFEKGSDFAVYLADDCVPSPDFVRLAIGLGEHCQTGITEAFGLWWPTDKRALKYPEIVLLRRGQGWPAKSWGCTKSGWPAIKHEIVSAEGTYDVILANACARLNWTLVVPLCSRVKDIGRYGYYDSPENWDEHFSWIAAVEEPFEGPYTIFQ